MSLEFTAVVVCGSLVFLVLGFIGSVFLYRYVQRQRELRILREQPSEEPLRIGKISPMVFPTIRGKSKATSGPKESTTLIRSANAPAASSKTSAGATLPKTSKPRTPATKGSAKGSAKASDKVPVVPNPATKGPAKAPDKVPVVPKPAVQTAALPTPSSQLAKSSDASDKPTVKTTTFPPFASKASDKPAKVAAPSISKASDKASTVPKPAVKEEEPASGVTMESGEEAAKQPS